MIRKKDTLENIIKEVRKANYADAFLYTDAIFFLILKKWPKVQLSTACDAVEFLREERKGYEEI